LIMIFAGVEKKAHAAFDDVHGDLDDEA
jgi:hypothetical protein